MALNLLLDYKYHGLKPVATIVIEATPLKYLLLQYFEHSKFETHRYKETFSI